MGWGTLVPVGNTTGSDDAFHVQWLAQGSNQVAGTPATLLTKSLSDETLRMINNLVVVMGTNVLGYYRHLVAASLAKWASAQRSRASPSCFSPKLPTDF